MKADGIDALEFLNGLFGGAVLAQPTAATAEPLRAPSATAPAFSPCYFDPKTGRVEPMTPADVARYETMFADGAEPEPADLTAAWKTAIDLADVPPCPKCGKIVPWWNPLDQQRCMVCDPIDGALRLLERAESFRRGI